MSSSVHAALCSRQCQMERSGLSSSMKNTRRDTNKIPRRATTVAIARFAARNSRNVRSCSAAQRLHSSRGGTRRCARRPRCIDSPSARQACVCRKSPSSILPQNAGNFEIARFISSDRCCIDACRRRSTRRVKCSCSSIVAATRTTSRARINVAAGPRNAPSAMRA